MNIIMSVLSQLKGGYLKVRGNEQQIRMATPFYTCLMVLYRKGSQLQYPGIDFLNLKVDRCPIIAWPLFEDQPFRQTRAIISCDRCCGKEMKGTQIVVLPALPKVASYAIPCNGSPFSCQS